MTVEGSERRGTAREWIIENEFLSWWCSCAWACTFLDTDGRANDGCVISSNILDLIIYPAIYMIWRSRELTKD